jgi:hypothetical protein
MINEYNVFAQEAVPAALSIGTFKKQLTLLVRRTGEIRVLGPDFQRSRSAPDFGNNRMGR